MKRDDALRAVGEYAAEQWGLFTAAQAQLLGVSGVDLKRLVDTDLIESRGRGVYLIGGAAAPEYELIKVAWLRLAPDLGAWERLSPGSHKAVVSHSSACLLHQLGDIPMPQAEFIVPVRKTTRHADVRLRVDELAADDVVVVAGLPVTSVERTIADLLKARADGGHVGRVVADALRRGLADRAALADRVAPHVRAYGLPARATGAELLVALLPQVHEASTSVDRALVELSGEPASIGQVHDAAWQAAQQLAASAAVPHADLVRSLAQIGRLDPAVIEAVTNIGRLDPAVLQAMATIQSTLSGSQYTRVMEEIRKIGASYTDVYEQIARAADLTAHLQPTRELAATLQRSLDGYARMQPSLPRALPSTQAELEKPSAGNSPSPSASRVYRDSKDKAGESSDTPAEADLEQQEQA